MSCIRWGLLERSLAAFPSDFKRILNRHLVLCYRLFSGQSFKPPDSYSVRNYKKSFQYWILDTFRTNQNYTSFSFPSCDTGSVSRRDDVINNRDLNSLLNLLWYKKSDESLTPKVLKSIDDQLCLKISRNSSAEDLLNCLQVYMTAVPVQSIKLQAFKNALVHLENRMKKSELSPHDIVQAMYYGSHLKKIALTHKFMPAAICQMKIATLNTLSIIDLGIFCVSLFRSSVPLNNPGLIQFVGERFKKEINSLIENHPAIFVSFVKCFRISKYYDEEMTNFISSQGLETLSKLDLVGKIHLAVYFAASHHSDVKFISAFLSSCIDESNDKIAELAPPRLKDLDNLLWSCGVYNMQQLNVKMEQSKILKYVQGTLDFLGKDVHKQVSLLLWLWVCEIRLQREVTRCLTFENCKLITDSKNFKSTANLFLLLTCVQVESPGCLKPHIFTVKDKRLQPKFDQYVNKRPSLKILLSTLEKYSAFLQLESVRFAFLVPALYVGSIYAEFQGMPLSIELIDPSVCLTNSDRLRGRMILKLRLLSIMGISVLKVPECASYDVEELKKRLRDLSTEKSSGPLDTHTGG